MAIFIPHQCHHPLRLQANFPPEDPTFAGVRFTYPFITDYFGLFLRASSAAYF